MMNVFQQVGWALFQPIQIIISLGVVLLIPILRLSRRNSDTAWVIGGHRGRMYADNSKALHQYICSQTKQPIYWIANKPLAKELKRDGYSVLTRNSIRAKIAILRSPVLIFSHGEDDLDQFAILWRGIIGFRVYLGHCLAHVKAGQFYSKHVDHMSSLRKLFFRWTMVDFDLLLASSSLEKKHFSLTLPHRQSRTVTGGGAHLDAFINIRNTLTDGRIIWFPTFRDSFIEARKLDQMIIEVVQNASLIRWLMASNRKLFICHHINSNNHASKVSLSAEATQCIQFCSPNSITELLAKCDLFISDYSGLTADWLIMDRPAIFFPFDIDSYLQTRRIFIPYPEYHYGPWVKNSDELISLLISEKWIDLTPWNERRNYWKNQMFPYLEPVYSQSSYQAILQHKKK